MTLSLNHVHIIHCNSSGPHHYCNTANAMITTTVMTIMTANTTPTFWAMTKLQFYDNFGRCRPIQQWTADKAELNLPPHLKSVAALPCKISMFNCATLQQLIQFRSDAKSFKGASIYFTSKLMEMGGRVHFLVSPLVLSSSTSALSWHSFMPPIRLILVQSHCLVI